MAKGGLQKARAAGRVERDAAEALRCSLDIEIDEQDGRLRIYDPRAFHAGRRGFCRRLLEAAAEQPGFEKAEVDLAAASCRLKFDPRSATARSMADAVAAAVHRAAAGGPDGDRRQWWSRAGRWATLTAYRTPVGVSWWETLDARPGRIRLRHEAVPDDGPRLSHLAEALATLDGIEESRVSPWSDTLTLDYRPGSPIAPGLLDAAEHTLREVSIAGGQTARPGHGDGPGSIPVATGFRRLRYLALAGGSFAMTVIGLVIPGIPTVPFLLATSYYLARSSPALNDRLRRTALFGPVLVEWEGHNGLSRYSKAKLMGLTLVVVLVTAALSAASPIILVVILIIALVSLYGIARIPGIPHETARTPLPSHAGRPALASP